MKDIKDIYTLWEKRNLIIDEICYSMFTMFGESSNVYHDVYNNKIYFLYLAGKTKYPHDYFINRGKYKDDKEYITSYNRLCPQKIRITSFIVILDSSSFTETSERTIVFLKDEYLQGKKQYLIKKLHKDLNSSVIKNLTRPFNDYAHSKELTGLQYNYILNAIKYSIDSKFIQLKTNQNIAKVLSTKAISETIDNLRFINKFLIQDYVDNSYKNTVYIPEDMKRPYIFFADKIRRRLKPAYIELLLKIIDDNTIIETFTEDQFKIIKNLTINFKTVHVYEKICLRMFNNVRNEYYYKLKYIFDAIKLSMTITQYHYDSKNLPF